MTQKKSRDEEMSGGIFSGIMDRAKDAVSEYIEFDEEEGASTKSAPDSSSLNNTPPTPYEPFTGAETQPMIPVQASQTSDVAVDFKIKQQLEKILRESKEPEVQVVLKYELQYQKLNMITDPTQRREAVLQICGVNVAQLIKGYETLLNLLNSERLNDKSMIESQISELLSQNSNKQSELRQRIQNNNGEIERLTDENGSLMTELNTLDSRVDREKQKYERGGLVFQVTADAVEQDLQKLLSDLQK